MAAIAERLLAGVFAAAKEQLAGFLGGAFDRRKAAALVAAIAKGLFLRFAAGTPEIAFALRHLDGKGAFLGDFGGFIGHGVGLSLAGCDADQGSRK